MTMYWPDQKVALVIEGDPSSDDFDESAHPDWTVVHAMPEAFEGPEAMAGLASMMAAIFEEQETGECCCDDDWEDPIYSY